MRRGGYRCDSGCVLTADAVSDGMRTTNQFDWIARADRAAPDHPGHLTRAPDHRLQGVGVDLEPFPARRPIAGDLELRLADAQPRPVMELHHGHALDGNVLAQ